jgi:hypothetical protein
MERPAILIQSLIEKAETYGKTTYKLSKLKAVEKSTRITTSLVSKFSAIIMFSIFGMFMSIGAAILLGELLGKSYFGFFIVALFYLITGILFHFFLYKWIKKPLSDLIIKLLLQKND